MAMWWLQDTHTQGETDGPTDKPKPISLRFTGDNKTYFFIRQWNEQQAHMQFCHEIHECECDQG